LTKGLFTADDASAFNLLVFGLDRTFSAAKLLTLVTCGEVLTANGARLYMRHTDLLTRRPDIEKWGVGVRCPTW
jgi:hypothetical protein